VNTFVKASVVALALISLSGCGAKQTDTTHSDSASAATATTSSLDSGPRAGDDPIDEALAKAGEPLFKDKGCSACHAFGTRMSGPDLNGVTMRRTAKWMENQILHPEVMTKQDPISRQLMGEYALQMPNQGLTPEQAKSVIEYLKHRDHEASEHAGEAGEHAEKKGEGS
jgi:mono/diheme cytochrome c family protein